MKKKEESALTQGISYFSSEGLNKPPPSSSQRHPQKAERLSDIALHSAD